MRQKHCYRTAARMAIALVIALTPVSSLVFAQSTCPATSDWFPHAKTPKPPFDTFQSSSNCAFHQWSWQAFLWVTQTDSATGQPRFLSFATPAALGGNGRPKALMPRMRKSAIPETIREYLQAGTDGMLIDQNGRATYYSQYLNRSFADFVTSNNLNNPATFAALDATRPFPNGILTLKASWKIVHSGEDSRSHFTMPADITLLANTNGTIVIDPSKTQRVTLALVGLHIVGRVNGHPEMIWATFEHMKNAPDVPANPTPDTVISTDDWTFYKGGTPYRLCNLNPAHSSEFKLDEATQTFSPITQVCRLYEFGNDPHDPVNKLEDITVNDQNIQLLNHEVRGKLQDAQDLWANYKEIGAIWFIKPNTLQPDDALANDALLTGSFKLSNATIETFTQTQSTMNNCFRCHNTLHRFPPAPNLQPLPGKNLNVSHIMVNGYFWEQETQGGDKP